MLCTICIKTLNVRTPRYTPPALFVSKNHWSRKAIEHHPDPFSLQQAAKSGCYICRTFYREHRKALLSGEYSQLQSGKSSYTVLYPSYLITGRWGFSMQVDTTEISLFLQVAPSSSFELFILQDKQPGFFQTIRNEKIFKTQDIRPVGNLPNAGMDIAQAWIQNCLRSHGLCNQHFITQGFVPTRLIDVSHGTSGGQWKLIHTSKNTKMSPYLTLSHCWGTTQTLRLLTANYTDFKAGMSDECLPVKYKDALSVTRSLGFRYVWIDSLCIIQDSQQDWLQESMTMHDVYRNSACTLAASNASNSDEKFLKQRSPSLHLAEIVQMNWIVESEGKLSFLSSPKRSGDMRYLINHHDFFRMSLSRSPLAQRAWCFQELLLSPRVLHFEEDQLFWECRTLKSCEAIPFITMPAITDIHTPVIADLFRGMTVEETPTFHIMRPSSHWHTILESYTKGNLTKGEDKFIALAGVAKAFQQKYGGEYLAGLWRHEMPYNLLWWVDRSKISHPQPLRFIEPVHTYRAPSWSWGSFDGLIRYVMTPVLEGTIPTYPKGEGSIDLVTVLDAKVTTALNNPFGQVTDGVIDLNGVLIPATTSTTISVSSPSVPDGSRFPKTDHDEFALEADPSIDLGRIFYLPITFGNTWLYGLLLYSATGSKSDGYVRVGWFSFGDESCAELGIKKLPLADGSNWPSVGLFNQMVRLY